MLGREQIHNPAHSLLEKAYIAAFGMPIVGLRIRARNIFSLIPKDRGYENILDAGSGPGVFSFELARRYSGASVIGIDLLKESIDQCQAIAGHVYAPNLAFKHTTIEDYRCDEGHDLIVSVDMLEHIEDDAAILRKFSELMRNNGTLVVHVPAMYRRYPVFKKSVNLDVRTHVRPGYTIENIKMKVKAAGFEIEQCGYTYGFWETLANNLSYMITGAKMQNKALYAIAFPFLMTISLFGYKARPKELGAGVYVVAIKHI
jgi:SAM-dependent methyltransferase